MGIDRCVSSCASEILAFSEWNMFPFGVSEALSEAEVDNIDIILGGFSPSNQKVIRFDVPMDDPLFMYFLYSLNLS